MFTKIVKNLVTLLAFTLSCHPQSDPARNPRSDDVAGVWRGNSNCMVKGSPCNDEINVYRIAKATGKADMMTVTGSKIVDGKEIVMGSSDWKYDPQKHTLDSPDGRIHLEVVGNNIEGAVILRDKTVYRRIHLKKDESISVTTPLRCFDSLRGLRQDAQVVPSTELGRNNDGSKSREFGSACGLRKSSGADFSVAAHAHVPTPSLRSFVGPGVSARSPRSVEMTVARVWFYWSLCFT